MLHVSWPTRRSDSASTLPAGMQRLHELPVDRTGHGATEPIDRGLGRSVVGV